MYTLTGILKVKGKVEQVSEKFKKLEFVLTDNSSQYPQHIPMQLTQDKCSLLDDRYEGQVITVFFNLRGRIWTNPQGQDKYILSLEAWKIEPSAGEANEPKSEPGSDQPIDDLPF